MGSIPITRSNSDRARQRETTSLSSRSSIAWVFDPIQGLLRGLTSSGRVVRITRSFGVRRGRCVVGVLQCVVLVVALAQLASARELDPACLTE